MSSNPFARPFARPAGRCGSGSPPCENAPLYGTPNPLSLCREHLDATPLAIAPCAACASEPDGTYTYVVGSLCFVCNRSASGVTGTPEHQCSARAAQHHRLRVLLVSARREAAAGTLNAWLETPPEYRGGVREFAPGREIKALLARCPEDIATKARPAFAKLGVK